MSTLSAAKLAVVMLDKFVDTYDDQDELLSMTDFHEPDPGKMQNAGNVIWTPIQQHRPVLTGFDLTGKETNLIEETYPAVLGTPNNDLVQQRADDMRDTRFWERSAEQSAKQQATQLNSDIASAVALQGSLFYRSNVTSGYEFIAEAQAIMNERQLAESTHCFIINDRENLKFATDLAARQTLQGKPAEVWTNSQIGRNIAGFDVYKGSYLPNLTGGADPGRTADGTQEFLPVGGTVNATTKVVTNVDYREASLVVDSTTSYNVGDKFQLDNSGTVINSLALASKDDTGKPMTFSVIEITDSTHLKIYPKPKFDSGAAETDNTFGSASFLTDAYANMSAQILTGAALTRLNIDASVKTNIFFDKNAVEVIGGTIPADLFKEFDGMKVVSSSLKNGLQAYMIFDANMITLNLRYRLFVWYGITIVDPSNCGVAISY